MRETGRFIHDSCLLDGGWSVPASTAFFSFFSFPALLSRSTNSLVGFEEDTSPLCDRCTLIPPQNRLSTHDFHFVRKHQYFLEGCHGRKEGWHSGILICSAKPGVKQRAALHCYRPLLSIPLPGGPLHWSSDSWFRDVSFFSYKMMSLRGSARDTCS